MERTVTPECLAAFERRLRDEEKSRSTLQYYLRNVRRFMEWLDGRPLSKEEAIAYKEELEREPYTKSSINTMLAALNSFFRFMGWDDCHLKHLEEQRKSYCLEDEELELEEFARLVEQAEREDKEKLVMLLYTFMATGARVSELRFITVEALRCGYAMVTNKGKTRPVILLEELRELLSAYVEKEGIESGSIFITRTGRPLDRSNIWHELKRLSVTAGVNPKKVFPHNFRHLFARLFYSLTKDIARLADVMGHSSISTTRRYIISTWKEHRAQLARLGSVLFAGGKKRIKKHRLRAVVLH